MKIERIDTEHGRFYKTPEGIFPSVTTVLASLPNPELDAWKKSIGEENAKEISSKATKNGTRLHSFCEDYLNGKNPKLDIFDKESYKGLTKHLDLIQPIAIEEQLYSSKLRVAGTLDCVGKYSNELCIIDFKTTSKIKHDGEFDSYWLQTAAYSVMVFERMNLVVPNLLIIMQDLTAGECRVFKQKSSIWLPKFKQIRDAYKN
jgi:ATP-dependent exoDNAse (exonuclease V) beta subunit